MKKVLPIGGQFWHLGQKTLVMGVLNTTPDSFSDGGKYVTIEAAVARALEIQAQGASIVDIGGMSTKPGAELISVEEELLRVVPVIKKLKESGALTIPISVDTFRSQVAKAAVAAGASMVNDVTGGTGYHSFFLPFFFFFFRFVISFLAGILGCTLLWRSWMYLCV